LYPPERIGGPRYRYARLVTGGPAAWYGAASQPAGLRFSGVV